MNIDFTLLAESLANRINNAVCVDEQNDYMHELMYININDSNVLVSLSKSKYYNPILYGYKIETQDEKGYVSILSWEHKDIKNVISRLKQEKIDISKKDKELITAVLDYIEYYIQQKLLF